MAAAEPTGWNTGSGGARAQGADKKGRAEAKKLSHAAIHVAVVEEKPSQVGGVARGARLLMFWGVLGSTLRGDAWHSGVYGQKKGQKS